MLTASQTDRQSNALTDGQTYKHTDIQSVRWTERQTHRQTFRRTVSQTDQLAGRAWLKTKCTRIEVALINIMQEEIKANLVCSHSICNYLDSLWYYMLFLFT